MRKLFVLLLVSAIVLYIVYSFGRVKEGFATTTSTPLNAENVKSTVDSVIIEYVGHYQKLFDLKSEDIRVKNRLQMIATDINVLNEQYPMIEYTIENLDYTPFKMLTTDDLKIVKDFLLRSVGTSTVGVTNFTKPADLADIDLMSNRLKSFYGFLQQKVPLAKQKLPDWVGPMVRTMLENLRNLKFKITTMKPEEVPIFASDFYYNALSFANANFVFPPNIVNGPPIEIKTNNLPIPSAPLRVLEKEIKKEVALAPVSIEEKPTKPVACPTCPTCPKCPKCPLPESKRFSEIVKELLVEDSIINAQREIFASRQF
jgi:hypothetical protein